MVVMLRRARARVAARWLAHRMRVAKAQTVRMAERQRELLDTGADPAVVAAAGFIAIRHGEAVGRLSDDARMGLSADEAADLRTRLVSALPDDRPDVLDFVIAKARAIPAPPVRRSVAALLAVALSLALVATGNGVAGLMLIGVGLTIAEPGIEGAAARGDRRTAVVWVVHRLVTLAWLGVVVGVVLGWVTG